jgi:SAM-dependent methyltransferase
MTSPAANANQAQFELWNGRGGEVWTRLQTRLDRLFEPLTERLMEAASAKAGESVTEIGCGCGDVTLLIAKACGQQGRVFAIDISTRMLDRAQVRDREYRDTGAVMAPIDWLEADAMLHPFEPRADLVISRFGVMFFADPVVAFRNIKHAMKPGSRLALLCWGRLDQNAWIHVPLEAVRTLIEPPPPLAANAPGPFAFAEPDYVLNILREAGFVDATSRQVESGLVLGSAQDNSLDPIQSAVEDALELALESGPVAALMRDADESMRSKVREAISAALRAHFNAERQDIALTATCQLYQAATR